MEVARARGRTLSGAWKIGVDSTGLQGEKSGSDPTRGAPPTPSTPNGSVATLARMGRVITDVLHGTGILSPQKIFTPGDRQSVLAVPWVVSYHLRSLTEI